MPGSATGSSAHSAVALVDVEDGVLLGYGPCTPLVIDILVDRVLQT
ncbi:hypothetical protein ACFZBP_02570 [Streptomyces sp. NPDC008086]